MNVDFSATLSKLRDESENRKELWEQLIERFFFPLRSRASQLAQTYPGSDIDSTDLVQETFIKAWKRQDTFEGEHLNQFAGWLFVILNNCFLDHCRRPQREILQTSWFGFEDGDLKTPSEQILDSEKESQLMAALATLDPEFQEVVCLRHMEGLKFREIAESCNLGINVVVGRYRRALESLRKIMAHLQ